MGTWGTAISSNDTYEDIYREFIDLYNEGLSVAEITEKLVRENKETIESIEDKNSFWFAIANGQWECKALDKNLLLKIEEIISSGSDLAVWKELGAKETEIKSREKALTKFLAKIKVEKDKPKTRKRKVLRDSIFQKGDCLIFKLENGNYGGALVLTSEKQTEFGMNMIATTTIDKKEKPIIEDFEKGFVLVQKEETIPGKYREREVISWYYAQFFKRSKIDFEIIGNLKISQEYNFNKDYTSASQWDMIKTAVDRNKDFVENRGKPDKVLQLKKLIKKHGL